MYLDCDNDDHRYEELVDMFLNNYCESIVKTTSNTCGSEYDNPGDDHSASISYFTALSIVDSANS